MSSHHPRLLVTAASGQLGQSVIAQLLAIVPAAEIAATVRTPEAAARLTALGVEARIADYADAGAWPGALAGIERVLLISSNALGRRVAQHRNVIEAAQRAGVGLLAYTSLLHADTSPLGLRHEHLGTEALLRASGVPFAILRNGWYTENYTAAIPAALAHNALIGSAGDGRISSAARTDYAAAAVAVLTAKEDWSSRVFELAGDTSYTLSEFAAEISRQSGTPIPYVNLPEGEYKAALLGAGLPEPVAALFSDSDVGASKGGLFDDSHELSRLIGRPTTPMVQSVTEALGRR